MTVKKQVWERLVSQEKKARGARFGRRVVLTMKNKRRSRRKSSQSAPWSKGRR